VHATARLVPGDVLVARLAFDDGDVAGSAGADGVERLGLTALAGEVEQATDEDRRGNVLLTVLAKAPELFSGGRS
jgi:hypothetical protein